MALRQLDHRQAAVALQLGQNSRIEAVEIHG